MGYCNSWEYAGSSPGPGVNPPGKPLPGKPLPGSTSGKTYPGKYLRENLSGTVSKPSRKTAPGNYLQENHSWVKVDPGGHSQARSFPGKEGHSQARSFLSKVVPSQGRPQRLLPGKQVQSHRVRGQSQCVPGPESSDPRNSSNPLCITQMCNSVMDI